MRTEKFRDITLTRLDDGTVIAVSCDSCGAVGEKEGDALCCPAKITGRYTARGALMEVLAVGAQPAVLTSAVCNEPQPTAEHILSGIREELKSAGLQNVFVNGSSEKNMPTVQTGLGVTVIGVCREPELKIQPPQPGDVLLVCGLPKMGGEVVLGEDGEIADYNCLRTLVQCESVRQIVPVGSRGIAAEAAELGNFVPVGSPAVDLQKSGGPSTCLIAAVCPQAVKELVRALKVPASVVGTFVS